MRTTSPSPRLPPLPHHGRNRSGKLPQPPPLSQSSKSGFRSLNIPVRESRHQELPLHFGLFTLCEQRPPLPNNAAGVTRYQRQLDEAVALFELRRLKRYTKNEIRRVTGGETKLQCQATHNPNDGTPPGWGKIFSLTTSGSCSTMPFSS